MRQVVRPVFVEFDRVRRVRWRENVWVAAAVLGRPPVPVHLDQDVRPVRGTPPPRACPAAAGLSRMVQDEAASPRPSAAGGAIGRRHLIASFPMAWRNAANRSITGGRGRPPVSVAGTRSGRQSAGKAGPNGQQGTARPVGSSGGCSCGQWPAPSSDSTTARPGRTSARPPHPPGGIGWTQGCLWTSTDWSAG